VLTYTLEDRVAIVKMDDGKANALSVAMIDKLLEALDRAQREAGAMVLAGRQDRFSGGFDLKVMMAGPDAARGLLVRGADLLMKLYATTIPLVVACTGHAMAAGALVVLTGDYRIGTEGTYKIGLNEAQIGLPVPVLAMELARDRLAPQALTRATLLGHVFEPADALAVGYYDEVLGAEHVLPRAIAEAKRLAAISPAAFKHTKTRLRGKTIAHVRATSDADLLELMSPAS